MTDFVNAAAVGLVLSLLVLSVSWFVMEGHQDVEARLVVVPNSWTTPEPSYSSFRAQLEVENPLRMAIDLVNLDYAVRLGDEVVYEGHHKEPLRVPPHGNASIVFDPRLPYAAFPAWLGRHLESSSNLVLSLTVDYTFQVGDRPTAMQSSWSRSSRIALPEAMAKVTNSCHADPNGPCLRGTSGKWYAGAGADNAVLEIVVENRADEAVVFRNISAALRFHDILVGTAGLAETPIIDPHGEARVDLPLSVPTGAWSVWWTAHVQDCERSPVGVTLDYDVSRVNATDDPGPIPYRWQLSGSVLQTRLLCNGE